MSRWLGTREDQDMAARLIAQIAQLFPDRPEKWSLISPCGSRLGGDGGVSVSKYAACDIAIASKPAPTDWISDRPFA